MAQVPGKWSRASSRTAGATSEATFAATSTPWSPAGHAANERTTASGRCAQAAPGRTNKTKRAKGVDRKAAHATRVALVAEAASTYDSREMGSAIIVHAGAGDWSAEDGDGEGPLGGCRDAARSVSASSEPQLLLAESIYARLSDADAT